MTAKKDSVLIVIDVNRFLFYTKKANNTLQLNLPTDVVNSLEVVNREKLDHLISLVFQLPSLRGRDFDATLLFSSNTTFEKELTSTNTKSEYEETQKFLDMVPFEEVLSNSYRINKKTRVVAVNKILYNILKQTLEKNKTHVSLVLPMPILAQTNPELTNKIDFPFIENKLESFKQYSLLDLEEIGLGGEVTNSMGIKRKDVRLYILILVMIGLFLVMIVLLYTTFIAVLKPVHKVIKNIPSISPTPVEIQSEIQESTDSAKISTPSGTVKTEIEIKKNP